MKRRLTRKREQPGWRNYQIWSIGGCGHTESVIRRELHQLVYTGHFFNTMLDTMPDTARASTIMRW